MAESDQSPTPGPPGLEAVTKRQDRAFATHRPVTDEMFEALASVGRNGLSVAVGLLVDGVVMTGAFGDPHVYAQAVEQAVRPALDVMGWDPETVDETASTFPRLTERRSERREQRRRLVEEHDATATIDALAPDDVVDYFAGLRDDAFVDLHDVRLYAGATASPPVEIDHVRVRVASIGAWWPLAAQQGATVTYSAPAEGS